MTTAAGKPGLRDDRLRLIAPTAVVLLTFLVFSGALSNGFVNWDDRAYLLDNDAWRGLDWSRLRWMMTAVGPGPYQPLSWLTFGVDYELWGLSAFAIHLTSLLLHCACALAVYFLGLRLIKDRAGAAAAALLFSLHPLRVESVAWAAERLDPLSGLFFLLTLSCWLRARRGWALGCAGLAMAAGKPHALMLPAVLLLLDVYPLGRLPADWRLWGRAPTRAVLLEKLPFAALSALFLALALYAQLVMNAIAPLSHTGWAPRMTNSLYSLVFYLGKTLWPAALSPLYFGGSPSDRVSLWIGGTAAAAIAWTALRRPSLRPALGAACAFYVLTLFPYLGLVKCGQQIAADRFTYMACLPWAWLAGAGLAGAGLAGAGRRRRPVMVLAAALLIALGAATRLQTRIWLNSVTLWRQARAVEPFGGDTHRQFLVKALLERGRTGEAVLYLEEELALFPGDFAARKVLTSLTGKDGPGDAGHAKIHRDLAEELRQDGDAEKAAWHERRARMYEERAARR